MGSNDDFSNSIRFLCQIAVWFETFAERRAQQDLTYLCSAEDADAEASGAGGPRGNRGRAR